MITIEQAIQNIMDIKSMYTWSTGADEALDMAISALEKQVPLKHLPYEMGADGTVLYPCGNCGEDVKGSDYCPWCGQKVGSE